MCVCLAGDDFTLVQQTLIFSSVVTSEVVSVPLLQDNEIEGDERFEANIIRVANQQVQVTIDPGVVTVTILDATLQ